MNSQHVLVLAFGTFVAGAASGDVVSTIDPGPLGPIGVANDTKQDFFGVQASVGGETLGRLDVLFTDGKSLEVNALDPVFGLTFIAIDVTGFGAPPSGGNWVTDITWGLLGPGSTTIASVTRDDQLIAGSSQGLNMLSVPADVPSGAPITGFFIEFADPQIGALGPNAAVTGVFVGDVRIVPAPGTAGLLGICAVAAARRRR
ncbi:MAG: hypothetical protein AAGJ54_04200 [Planctomycetota bacterium]